MTAPVAYAADEAAAKAAFEGAGQDGRLATSSPSRRPSRPSSRSTTRAASTWSPRQGRQGAGRPHRRQDRPARARWSARPARTRSGRPPASPRYLFDKAPADWRDKSITTFTAGDAEKIEVVGQGRRQGRSLKKTGAKAGARGQVGRRRVVGEDRQARQQRPERHRRRRCRSGRRTTSPTASSRPTPGSTPPALTVTVGLKGGKKVTVLIGNKKGDDEFYVKTADAPQVFVVKKYNVERVNKRPIEFRDKTLCDIAGHRRHRDRGHPRRQLVHAGQERQRLEGDQAGQARARPGQGHARSPARSRTGRRTSFAEDATPKTQRPGQAAGDHRREGQGQGGDLHRQGRRRDQGQAQLLRHERQGPRRLPGAQVERRPRPGQGRRPQEGRGTSQRRRARAAPVAAAKGPKKK